MKLEINKDTGKVGIRMREMRRLIKERIPEGNPEMILYRLLREPEDKTKIETGLILKFQDQIAFVYLTKDLRFTIDPSKNLTVVLTSISEMLLLPVRVQNVLESRIKLVLTP